MEESLKQTGQRFAWTLKYGFLSCSPENIGTGLEVQVKVPLLTAVLKLTKVQNAV